MRFELWYLIIGGLLVAMALAASVFKRLPLTTTMLYLGLGVVLGPTAFRAVTVDPVAHAAVLERISELAVIVSLFTAGLKLRLPLHDRTWWIPVRMAFVAMAATVGLVAAVGVFGLGLPVGAAVLLGAVLAPTDPVLASEVQLESAADRDKLRFSITGEAGLNDGTAFPFVMLGLGLLGYHELGAGGWRWVTVDVLWAIPGGLAIGGVLGLLIGRVVIYLRREHKEGVGRDEFLALGLIASSYGIALLAHTYGFLAVFAAGLALRGVERQHTGSAPPADVAALAAVGQTAAATHPEKAPAYMAEAVLGFNQQVERILEVGLVLLVGAMLWPQMIRGADVWFIPVLFLLIRPVSVFVGLAGCVATWRQRTLMSWFGIRGIGSLYYITHAIGYGLPEELSRRLISLTLSVIAVSVVVHGISVTPLMKWYEAQRRR